MKTFLGYVTNKIVQAIPRSKKVSPDIKSVKPTKDISGSVERVKTKEYTKRIDATNKSKGKIDQGRKMMREGQKELRRQVDTGKAFKFKYGTAREKTFPIQPGKNPKKEHGDLVEESKPQKKFKKGKELERKKKMGGGMMGRRFGMKSGTPFKKETNVDKIKKTFAPKGKIKFDAKKSDLDKSGSLSPYEKRRGMAIAKAMAKRKKKA